MKILDLAWAVDPDQTVTELLSMIEVAEKEGKTISVGVLRQFLGTLASGGKLCE
jgi:hypothetical protein